VQVDAADSGLVIADFQVSPTQIQLGETFTLSGQVVNVGSYSAFRVSLSRFFKNMSAAYLPLLKEMPSEVIRHIDEFKPGEVWNFTLTLRAMSVDSFDIGIYVIYTKNFEGSHGTEVRSGTVRVEVSRLPPQIPSWLNWWTVVILTGIIAVIGWRLKWLGRFRQMWGIIVIVVSVMVAIGAIVYVVLLNSQWTPVMILGSPLIVLALGFLSKKALVSFLAPVIPTVAVTSAVEMLNLMTQYYSSGELVFAFTLFSLSWGLMGSGVALRRQGRAVGMVLIFVGILTWFIVWANAFGSG